MLNKIIKSRTLEKTYWKNIQKRLLTKQKGKRKKINDLINICLILGTHYEK